ncbi:hypothetical protein J2Y70_002586 [Xanthomonas translucens]|nr:hypothetical protein [Xanthomonas translucens]
MASAAPVALACAFLRPECMRPWIGRTVFSHPDAWACNENAAAVAGRGADAGRARYCGAAGALVRGITYEVMYSPLEP